MDYLIAPALGYTESEIHRRSADRIVQGCLQNGGIYVKLGQGLAAVNHILPREYIESLSILQVYFYRCKTINIKDKNNIMFVMTFGAFKQNTHKLNLYIHAHTNCIHIYFFVLLFSKTIIM